MHIPFGIAALGIGALGLVMYVLQMIADNGPSSEDYPLLAASVAAFVAGWVACVSIPKLERRLRDGSTAVAQPE